MLRAATLRNIIGLPAPERSLARDAGDRAAALETPEQHLDERHLPRFSGEARALDETLVQGLRAQAAPRGRTPAPLCLAYVLA